MDDIFKVNHEKLELKEEKLEINEEKLEITEQKYVIIDDIKHDSKYYHSHMIKCKLNDEIECELKIEKIDIKDEIVKDQIEFDEDE
jgi:hypothetical protein